MDGSLDKRRVHGLVPCCGQDVDGYRAQVLQHPIDSNRNIHTSFWQALANVTKIVIFIEQQIVSIIFLNTFINKRACALNCDWSTDVRNLSAFPQKCLRTTDLPLIYFLLYSYCVLSLLSSSNFYFTINTFLWRKIALCLYSIFANIFKTL